MFPFHNFKLSFSKTQFLSLKSLEFQVTRVKDDKGAKLTPVPNDTGAYHTKVKAQQGKQKFPWQSLF